MGEGSSAVCICYCTYCTVLTSPKYPLSVRFALRICLFALLTTGEGNGTGV